MLCPYSLRLNREIEVPAVAVHEHEGGIFGGELVRHVLEVAEGRGRLAVDFRDDVADLHAGLAGRTAVGHARHHNAPLAVPGKVEPAGQLRGQLAHVQAGERARGPRLLVAVTRALRLDHGPRLLGDRHVKLLRLSVPEHLDVHLLADGRLGHKVAELSGVLDDPPVELDDHVPALQPGAPGRAVGQYVADQDALGLGHAELFGEVLGQLLDRHTEVPADDLAPLEQLFHHRPDHVARHGEADPHVAAALAEDGRIDANELAPRVDQRAAGVARIDRRVGLDEVLVLGDADVGAAHRADDPHRHRLVEAKGVADGQHVLTYLKFVGIGPGDGRQVLGLHLNDRDVGLWVGAHHLSLELPLVRAQYAVLFRIRDCGVVHGECG